MRTKISKVINECETSLINKYERHSYNAVFSGPMLAKRPFDVFDTFSFDGSKFLTIIDIFSRYTETYFINDASGITIFGKLRLYFTHQNYPKK